MQTNTATARAHFHRRLTELQAELPLCRSTRQLRMVEGAILATKAWLEAVSQ